MKSYKPMQGKNALLIIQQFNLKFNPFRILYNFRSI